MLLRWPRQIGTILAAGVAATAVACTMTFFLSFALVTATWSDGADKWSATLLIGAAAAYFTLGAFPIVFLLVGFPLYAFSLRIGQVSAGAYATVGAIVSCVVAFAAWVVIGKSLTLDLMLPCIVCGGTAATLAFWMVARPDQSCLHVEE